MYQSIGASYRGQLLDKNHKENYPVITLVLYFGTDHPRSKEKSLLECMNVPNQLKKYVNDYKINIVDVAFLTDEQVAMFQSDFHIVADYFVQMRKNKDYTPSQEEIKHVDAVLKLMSVLNDDDRFIEKQREKREVTTMCEVLDRAEARGEARGEVRGEILGRIKAYRDVGMSDDDIMKKIQILYELSEEKVGQYLALCEV